MASPGSEVDGGKGMKLVTDEERRARMARRHLLFEPADRVVDVVDSVVALHATDPASVNLSIWARMPAVGLDDIDSALYRDRALLRIHGMRRTLWVVSRNLATAIEVGIGADVAARERRQLLRSVAEHIQGDADRWYERARLGVIEFLSEHSSAFGDELRDAIPELQMRIPYGNGSSGVGSRVLFQMGVEGDIIRTAPRGSWRSNAYAWRLRTDWAPVADDLPSTARAQARLADHWLRAFGPGTLQDLSWWTGWGKRVTERALRDCEAVGVRLEDGAEAYVAAEDQLSFPSVGRWVALLPALDPTTMGWKRRGWYLGDHADRLFDRNGNAGPTVWVDGRVVGGWVQRPEGQVVTRFLEPIDDDARDRITALAKRMQAWLGDHVVVPRFRTPLERDLST